MTANTPLPIPSKAAIRALRGLVLGTSCTLALITEDRRRRINAARSAIHNGDRIRSARRYHAGGSPFSAALEEESVPVEPGVVHWTERDATTRPRDGKKAEAKAKTTPNVPPPGLLDWTDSVPSISRRHGHKQDSERQSTSWRTSRLLRDDESSVALTAASLSFLTSPQPTSTSAPASTSTESQPSKPGTQKTASPSTTSQSSIPRQAQGAASSLANQAQAYRNRTQPSVPKGGAEAKKTKAKPRASVRGESFEAYLRSDKLEAAAVRLRQIIKRVRGPEAVAHALWATATRRNTRPLWRLSAEMCRECLDEDRSSYAAELLRNAVRCGQLDEALYFAHEPMLVVREVAPVYELPLEEVEADAKTAEDAAKWREFYLRLNSGTLLFLPPLNTEPSKRRPVSPEVAYTARALLECAMAIRAEQRRRLVRNIFTAVTAYPGDLSNLLCWFVAELLEVGDYDILLWAFLTRPPTDASTLSDRAFFQIGNSVVEAVRLHPAPTTAVAAIPEVLRLMLAVCKPASDGVPPRRLKTTWVADLFYTHWQKTHDFAQIQQLFAMLTSENSDVAARVYYANGACRVMVQIALEAGRMSDAQRYCDDLVAQDPTTEGDIRLMGLFALVKAKQGDWPGVRTHFATAAALSGTRTKSGAPLLPRADRVFVPIVKEYMQTHTIGETETFLRTYIDELGVPVAREMVTLLANAYGSLGEVQSFIGWLTYCAGAGFTVDAAFSNAILQSCYRHWKFAYRDLLALHQQLYTLSPSFEDDVTRRIMTTAAVADANRHNRQYLPRPRPLSFSYSASSPPVTARRPAPRSKHDVYITMKEAFMTGRPGKTVRVYKAALRDGLIVPAGKCLKLAVAAALRCGQTQSHGAPSLPTANHFDAAIALLRSAHDAGQNIDAATTYIALAYIDALCPRAAMSVPPTASAARRNQAARVKAIRVADTVKDVLGRLAACGVQMSDLALNRAAFHLFRAGHLRGAVALALSAVEAAGAPSPGYNVWNFSVLMSTYAKLVEADGIRRVAAGAAAVGSAVTGERMGYQVLKQARRELRKRVTAETRAAETGDVHQRAEAEETLRAVEEALAQVRMARQQLGAERAELQTATMSIMRQAAQDAAAGGLGGIDGDESASSEDSRRTGASSRSRASSISSLDPLDALDPLDELDPLDSLLDQTVAAQAEEAAFAAKMAEAAKAAEAAEAAKASKAHDDGAAPVDDKPV